MIFLGFHVFCTEGRTGGGEVGSLARFTNGKNRGSRGYWENNKYIGGIWDLTTSWEAGLTQNLGMGCGIDHTIILCSFIILRYKSYFIFTEASKHV